MQIVYGVGGERDLTERVVDHLPGYAGGDVRVGNDAWRQRQLDVLGEVLDAAHLLLADEDADVDVALADLLVGLADRAAAAWQEPDAGMWEARETLRHYTSSKVMSTPHGGWRTRSRCGRSGCRAVTAIDLGLALTRQKPIGRPA